MPRVHQITFVEVDAPVVGPVTKFGGRPGWIEAPAWPLSRSTGGPMRFIGQVALDPSIFGPVPARMAYLFMTDEGPFEHTDGTWEADSGENAVILQPGGHDGPTAPLEDGPTLYQHNPDVKDKWEFDPCEFATTLAEVDEPEHDPDDEDDVEGPVFLNKLGGTPRFVQYDEFPEGGPWRLLLQLNAGEVPFEVNFGDMGVGYAFLAEDGTAAKFLWQCS